MAVFSLLRCTEAIALGDHRLIFNRVVRSASKPRIALDYVAVQGWMAALCSYVLEDSERRRYRTGDPIQGDLQAGHLTNENGKGYGYTLGTLRPPRVT